MPYLSRIANDLLVTPFDKKAFVENEISKKLTEKEFCEYCYSTPMFEKSDDLPISESDRLDDTEFIMKLNEIREKYYEQKNNYRNFKIWLDNFRISKVYTINGNAGTGKTTFVNYEKNKNKNIRWIILDIYEAPNRIEWMPDIGTTISRFARAQSKVYSCILKKIQEEAFIELDEDKQYSVEKSYKKISKIVENYRRKYAGKYPLGRVLFNKMIEIVDLEKSTDAKMEDLARLFQAEFNGETGKDGRGTDNALNVLLLILLCKAEDKQERSIIVFDNFERFIKSNELYNKDINTVRLQLDNYVERINQEGNCFYEKLKFALAVRDGTARMCNVSLHSADTAPSNLDLNGWYDVDNIIQRKKEWYKKSGIVIENIDLVEQIVGDYRRCGDNTLTGLKLTLEPLFNGNKRLLIDFIGGMLERPSDKEILNKYIALWKEDTSLARFAARSIIRGLVLYNIERNKDHLFEHLKTYSSHRNYNGLGDARKLLTILYNHIQNGEDNEMPVSEVLSKLFVTDNISEIWPSDEYTEKRKTISEILFFMNSYNNRENDGIQFVEIQYRNEGKDSEHNIEAGSPDELENIITNNMKNYTIRLMPAGRIYLERIVASFEFFSFRYCKQYTPLFALIPTVEEIKTAKTEELPCYKTICVVTKYASQCMEKLMNGEDSIRINTVNGEGVLHSTRIRNQHKSYIQNFILYITKKYIDNNSTIDDRYKEKYRCLIEKIRVELGKYGATQHRH